MAFIDLTLVFTVAFETSNFYLFAQTYPLPWHIFSVIKAGKIVQRAGDFMVKLIDKPKYK